MTSYAYMEEEFIKRTVELINQYDELVLDKVEPGDEREVTLLLNCLMGLLVYPFELAERKQRINGGWLKNDRVVDVGPSWGIEREYIKYAGVGSTRRDLSTHKLYLEEADIARLSMRDLLRHMRNCTAHARFNTTPNSSSSGKIDTIIFEAEPERKGFYMELPVTALRTFVFELAKSALDALEQHST